MYSLSCVTLVAEINTKNLHFNLCPALKLQFFNGYMACSEHKMSTFYCHILTIDVVCQMPLNTYINIPVTYNTSSVYHVFTLQFFL